MLFTIRPPICGAVHMSAPAEGYIIRLTQTRAERQLFLQRALMIGVRRSWAAGSRALFVKRQESMTDNVSAQKDYFIGSGIVQRLVPAAELGGTDRQSCIENNCYGKIKFRILVRFVPPIPADNAPRVKKSKADAGEPQLPMQTGDILDIADVMQIERLADVRIIS